MPRRRPRPPPPGWKPNSKAPDSIPELDAPRDWADGFLLRVPQEYLSFGKNRAVPTRYRPAVSLARTGLWFRVLPCTTQPKHDFFKLPAQAVLKRKTDNRDSYVRPYYETVHRWEPQPPHRQLRKLGVLPHELRIRIEQWLNTRTRG